MNAVRGQLDLRITLGKQHGIDLRSKSDAQVAEAIIKKEMIRRTGRCDKGRKVSGMKGRNSTTISRNSSNSDRRNSTIFAILFMIHRWLSVRVDM